jgi:hypothetical protein
MNDKKRECEKHPAYGMVSFNRVSHSTGSSNRLFGSSIDDHHTSIMLEIKEASVRHDLARDWFFPEKALIQVELSQIQFAELLTTMNAGSGIPCTIRWLRDKGFLPQLEASRLEVDKIREEFEGEIGDLVADMRKAFKDVSKLFEKQSVSKSDRRKALDIIEAAIRLMEDSAPFTVDQFNKAAEKVVTSAKAEVDGFVTHVVQKTGLEALAKKRLIQDSTIHGDTKKIGGSDV